MSQALERLFDMIATLLMTVFSYPILLIASFLILLLLHKQYARRHSAEYNGFYLTLTSVLVSNVHKSEKDLNFFVTTTASRRNEPVCGRLPYSLRALCLGVVESLDGDCYRLHVPLRMVGTGE